MFSSKPHILILGSLNTDLVTITPRIPHAGETLTATSFSTGPGGKGANQAVACARSSRISRPSTAFSTTPQSSFHPLSTHSPSSAHPPPQPSSTAQPQADVSHKDEDEVLADVSFLGAVGSNDLLPLHALAENGVDTSAVKILQDVRTGTATILVEEATGENRIMVVPGANARVRPTLLREESWRRVLRGEEGSMKEGDGGGAGGGGRKRKPNLLVMQLEIPLDTVVEAVRMAREVGMGVLLNPTPVPAGMEEIRALEEILGGVEWLVVNEGEAEALAGLEADGEAGAEDRGEGETKGKAKEAGSDEWLDAAFSVLRRKGASNVVVTLGGEGAAYSTDKRRGWERFSAAKVERVVDTTAAGDTFVGAFAVEVVKSVRGKGEHVDVGTAVRSACRAATRAVEREGAISSIPWRDEWNGE